MSARVDLVRCIYLIRWLIEDRGYTRGMNKRLASKIDKFIKDRRRSEGGWPPVADGDIQQLYEVIRAIINAKFDLDPDGSSVIEFRIVDRSKGWMPYFQAMPYSHKIDNDGDWETLFEIALNNLGEAQRAIDTALRVRKLLCREKA